MAEQKNRETRHPIWTELDALSALHSRMGMRLVALRAAVATMNLTAPESERVACPDCGMPFRNDRELLAHVERWTDAESLEAWLGADVVPAGVTARMVERHRAERDPR